MVTGEGASTCVGAVHAGRQANQQQVRGRVSEGRHGAGMVVRIVGSHLVEALVADGQSVRVIGRSATKLSVFDGQPVQPSTEACLRSGEAVFSLGKPHARGDTARTGEVQGSRPVSWIKVGLAAVVVAAIVGAAAYFLR